MKVVDTILRSAVLVVASVSEYYVNSWMKRGIPTEGVYTGVLEVNTFTVCTFNMWCNVH